MFHIWTQVKKQTSKPVALFKLTVWVCMLALAHIDFKVDVYKRVPACVGVCCSFISQGKECWWGVAKQADKIVKHPGPTPEHGQLFLRGREGMGGDACCHLCRQTTGMCWSSLTPLLFYCIVLYCILCRVWCTKLACEACHSQSINVLEWMPLYAGVKNIHILTRS